jgi:hypothetical protein
MFMKKLEIIKQENRGNQTIPNQIKMVSRGG